MANRDGERIRRIVRRGSSREPEQQLDHLLNLMLFRPSITDNGALDLGRRVLEDRKLDLDCREHGDAARVPELERTSTVGRKEDALESDAIGPTVGEQIREAMVDGEEFLGKREHGGAGDRAAHHQAMPRSVTLDATVTGAFGAGIDPEDLHASDASISFSAISKFDQTCWTSSCSSRASMSLTICCAGLPSSFT